ncbi:hypothetical protein LUZ60_011814 [Juncus effusus]|nr:hypothetical protein LUZ60_011814 [Juncus effusus]
MNFGGMFDTGSGTIPYGTGNSLSHPVRLISRPGFSSAGLSLGLQTNMEAQGDMSHMVNFVNGGNASGDGDSIGKNKEDENESRSGSDNLDGINSGDDLEQGNSKKKKRYHRHTPQQIQELENVFKDCPHPDEKQRLELSRRLNLESRQVKFWFQNRRTQMKTQIERHENSLLRQENDKLRAENLTIRDAMRNPICNNCGGPAMLGEVSLEEQHLRIENARLKDELDRVCALAGKFLGRPVSSLANPIPQIPLELGMGNNGFAGLGSVAPTLPAIPDFMTSSLSSPIGSTQMRNLDGMDGPLEKTMLLEIALAAMEELVKIAQMEDPIWIKNPNGGPDSLNFDEYVQVFPRVVGAKPVGHVAEATRDVGMVIINSTALVETLMDSNRWADMFPCMIAKATTSGIISSGMGGTRNGALQLMHSEIQVASPLVPVREASFLRFCKQHAEGVWAVVDISIDGMREAPSSSSAEYMTCRRLPSGILVQDMPNGYSRVIWVEHVEYDETVVHQSYQTLVRSGLAFGARRWLATLQRQCECLAILMSSSLPTREHNVITPNGQRSMLKLARRMTTQFCNSVCATGPRIWQRQQEWGPATNGIRLLSRQGTNEPDEAPGLVLSAATSVWFPVSPQRLFDYLRNERNRAEWDILSNGPMQEITHIAKGQDNGNAVSVLRPNTDGGRGMLVVQETCIDASGAMVVHTTIDIPTMHLVMNGGDSTYVAILPSGFIILPDGRCNSNSASNGPSDIKFENNNNNTNATGSLVTVAFQILVNTLPAGKLNHESVMTVRSLLTSTIDRIKSALLPTDIHQTP